MSVEPFEWDNAQWAIINNKYGQLLTYNLPRYNRRYARGDYQANITEMIESRNYDTFVDVGAYIGFFSQIATHYCWNVIAYEAHPFYYGILLLNMRFYMNVSCRYRFVSMEGDVPKMNGIKALVPYEGDVPYNIEVVSLDSEWSYGIPESTLIKLDVEGNELKVLEGSKEILKKPFVHWIIDIHTQYGIKVEDILKYFPNRNITMISPKVMKVEGKK